MVLKEQEIQIDGRFPLAGTLTIPNDRQEKHPVLVMIHGSGEMDRDENARRMPINAFKELSDLVASEGFATLRYDKRGVGKSEGDYFKTGLQDLIDDAICAVNFAADHPEIDKDQIIILGHSEGCLIAPVVHRRLNVQGIILLAGSAEPLAETTVWQREAIKKDMREKDGFQGLLLRLLKADEKLEKMNRKLMEKIATSDEPVVRFKGRKINAKWDREHQNFDVRPYLPKVSCPVLAITGDKDVQVKAEHVHHICELVSGSCETHIIENMTHLLRKTDKEHKIGTILRDYKNQVKQPVDDELKERVVEWLIGWKKGQL